MKEQVKGRCHLPKTAKYESCIAEFFVISRRFYNAFYETSVIFVDKK